MGTSLSDKAINNLTETDIKDIILFFENISIYIYDRHYKLTNIITKLATKTEGDLRERMIKIIFHLVESDLSALYALIVLDPDILLNGRYHKILLENLKTSQYQIGDLIFGLLIKNKLL